MNVCMYNGLHLLGHADLQYTAAEEPWELSGWELVLDCALSELLSKLFPDNMHTHTELEQTHTHTFAKRDDNQSYILKAKTQKKCHSEEW